MEANFGGVYSLHSSPYIGRSNPMPTRQTYVAPNVAYNDAEKIANSLVALANYTLASVNPRDVQQNPTYGETDTEITSELSRLQKHPKLTTFEGLKRNSKYAITVNNSGRLMVDGNLYDGVIKTIGKDETKYVEYKLGNPVTIVSQYLDSETGEISDKMVMKLTKYEYCKMSPYVTKTEKSLIFEENWDNPGSESYLAVPPEVQAHAGITQKDNLIKNFS
ncbi:MAG: hypothetical protein IJB79_03760 [Candidatus Gastranaerophilales bacterium]|nr:hypothetical protein [Candidatus Gastranaerophilales bacterium]